ncbi:MAG: GNAT family N-acetyltransferase [Clostridia bacterium]|nr:GNAT family N-acetyltransferase [Clostridia bacterium]
MNIEKMVDHLETERLVLFPYTRDNLALFNSDLPGFEKEFGVVYRGEELDYLLSGFLKKLEREIADDPEHYLFFTEFLIVLKAGSHIIGSIDYKYVPRDGITEVGYGLNPAYEGHGYMTEALTAFLEFGRKAGIRVVRADTRKDNVRSQNVLKRCGFCFCGKTAICGGNGRLTKAVPRYADRPRQCMFTVKAAMRRKPTAMRRCFPDVI